MKQVLVAVVLLTTATLSSAQQEQNFPSVITVVIQGVEEEIPSEVFEVVKVLQSRGYTLLEPVLFEVLRPCALPPRKGTMWTSKAACLAKVTNPDTDYLLLAVVVNSVQSLSGVYTKGRFGIRTPAERRDVVTSTFVYFSLVDIPAQRVLKNGRTSLVRNTSVTWKGRVRDTSWTESVPQLQLRTLVEMAKDVPKAPRERQ
jgi:hypothetical protein